MTATESRATCRGLTDEVAAARRMVVITKRGRPVATLVLFRQKPPSLLGMDRGRMEILGDIIVPSDVEWDMEVNPHRVLNP